jgi:hypothetical protein
VIVLLRAEGTVPYDRSYGEDRLRRGCVVMTNLPPFDRCFPLAGSIFRCLGTNQIATLLCLWIAEVVLWLSGVSFLEERTFHAVCQSYGLVVLLGIGAINGSIAMLVVASKRLTKLVPYCLSLIDNPDAGYELVIKTVFDRTTYTLSVGCVMTMGYATFITLGLAVPRLTLVILHIGFAFVFTFLGLSIGFAVNFWRFVFQFGSLSLKLDATHWDRMGGLRPIGSANALVLYFGAGLIALSCAGAYYAPYHHIDRRYLYVWFAGALIFFLMGLFLPTLRLHRLLLDARDHQRQRLSNLRYIVFTSFENSLISGAGSRSVISLKEATDLLKYFEGAAAELVAWPYEHTGRILARLVSIQGVASILAHWNLPAQLIK